MRSNVGVSLSHLLLVLMTCVSASNLVPEPAHVAPGEGQLAVDSSFSVAFDTASYQDRRLAAAAQRFVERLSRQTEIPLRWGAPISGRISLSIRCAAAGPAHPTLGEDETYRLEISPGGAKLTAPAATGVLRGLETFEQLVEAGPDGFFAPALTIEDKPRYPWRGLMLDVARHWMPLDVVERNLDAMAAVKMNVFHWHLSDDQGFRVECKRFPKLHQLGSDGNFYTQAQVRQVIEYARDRGIRVVPEFDIPGHTTAWLVGYPELGSAPGPYQIERNWGIFKPTIDPTRESTYVFLDAFLAEMAALFPDPYFHIGGDEVDDTQWKASTRIQAFAQRHGFQTSADLHAYFNRRIQAILKKHGKTMLGWDEVLHDGIQTSAVIQSWRGKESLAEAAKKGHRGILSNGYYLDHLDTAAFHYRNDPGEDADGRILGGEACMWTEYVDTETVDSRIWPRAAAVAERLWSPATVQDVPSLYARLIGLSHTLDWVGVRHRSNYVEMLDRIAGGSSDTPIRTTADAVEPLGIDIRQAAGHYDSSTPLNRLVDAARPESETIWRLEKIAREGQNRDQLRTAFAVWSKAGQVGRDNFLLAEVAAVAADLATVGSIGLQILDQMESGKAVPENWISEQKQILDKLDQPKAEVRLAAVRPVRILLEQLAQHGAAPGTAARSPLND
jgi:hexosaminidase